MSEKDPNIQRCTQVAEELGLSLMNVVSVLKLLLEGNTIPFIARYRKEATGNLDEVKLREIDDRYKYLTELEERKEAILKSIDSQGKLTEELKKKILDCTAKNILEDLYLPYKPKRRTRAMIAREKGLEPLAQLLMDQPSGIDPLSVAEAYVDPEKGVEDVEAALAGARDIVAEVVAETAEIRGMIRDAFWEEGVVVSKVVEGHASEKTKFQNYYDFKEKVSTIPSHRYLAIRRGEREGILTLRIEIPDDVYILQIQKFLGVDKSSKCADHYIKAIEDAYHRLLLPGVETDVRVDLKMKSDGAAVEIFAENLKNLLLAPPLGERTVIGIDPGLRTGCKCAAVDMTGKFLATTTFNIVRGERYEEVERRGLLEFIKKHHPFAIAIGNGTAGRETEAFVKGLLKQEGLNEICVVSVSESGASVYSASDVAREEFPDLDLTIRGAISIARRLQDPLAELVKVDPKAIGVGQYQHDVYQNLLQQKLGDVVESCVNYVGVELNTASAELLSYVAGIGPSMAKKIVATRNLIGKFKNRKQLLEVPGLGERTFRQAAGFLRIRDGDNPLDSSAVHPESYPIVEKILQDLNQPLHEVIGNAKIIEAVDMKKYICSEAGEFTLKDLLNELRKPGRDPRSTFERPQFRDDIMTMNDLQPGMVLEGCVTNVTAFGAFVDIGVHQDGLVHISELSSGYVKDPGEVVKTGDKLKVKVLEVDLDRKRISLSTRLDNAAVGRKEPQASQGARQQRNVPKQKKFEANPFANLF